MHVSQPCNHKVSYKDRQCQLKNPVEQLADPDAGLTMTTRSGYIMAYQRRITAGLPGWSLQRTF